MNIHESYIKKCIEIARQAEGCVAPNPLVGAVVIDKDGTFLAEGFHQRYGENHAEVNALNIAGNKAKGGTLYVNLEPCSHYGKTPPCADRVIESGVKTLVVGMVDPNPLVAGKGVEKIKKAGIEVITGVLEKECRELNEIFIKNILQKKPFVAIKTASTMDGKIAAHTGNSKWITSESAREKVHSLRNKYDAVLTGTGTVLADNPSLNCRKTPTGRNPVRVVVDSDLKLHPDFKVFNDDGTKTYIATSEVVDEKRIQAFAKNVDFIKCPLNEENKIDLQYLLSRLYERGICSVMVESGGRLNGAFLKKNLVDKVYLFMAPKILGDSKAYSSFDGITANFIDDCKKMMFNKIESFGPDILIEGYPE